jgi:hypothetical protein
MVTTMGDDEGFSSAASPMRPVKFFALLSPVPFIIIVKKE